MKKQDPFDVATLFDKPARTMSEFQASMLKTLRTLYVEGDGGERQDCRVVRVESLGRRLKDVVGGRVFWVTDVDSGDRFEMCVFAESSVNGQRRRVGLYSDGAEVSSYDRYERSQTAATNLMRRRPQYSGR